MMTDPEILDAYRKVALDITLENEPFVLRRCNHFFIKAEVNSSKHSFLLKLGEAFPGPDGPIIALQTKQQLTNQVLDFVNQADRAEDAA